jgi:hypothetical protein
MKSDRFLLKSDTDWYLTALVKPDVTDLYLALNRSQDLLVDDKYIYSFDIEIFDVDAQKFIGREPWTRIEPYCWCRLPKIPVPFDENNYDDETMYKLDGISEKTLNKMIDTAHEMFPSKKEDKSNE